MLNLEQALFLIRSSVNAAYSLANFQGFNNVVSQWSPPLGKIFSGKHSPFPATFRPRGLQCSCWQLFAQSPTAVTCPVHPVPCSQCCSSAQPSPGFASSVLCHWGVTGTVEEVLSTVTFRTSCVIYHGKWHFLFLVWARQKKCHCPNLQYLILLMVCSCLHKLQCLGLLVFFSCKAVTKKKKYYWGLASKIYLFFKMHAVTHMSIKWSHKP